MQEQQRSMWAEEVDDRFGAFEYEIRRYEGGGFEVEEWASYGAANIQRAPSL